MPPSLERLHKTPLQRDVASSSESTARAGTALALLFLTTAVNWIDRVLIGVLIEPMRLELSLSDLQIGLITGPAFAVTYALSGFAFAYWADYGNRRSLLAFSVGAWSAATALCGLAGSFLQLFALRLLVGLGEAGSFPTTLSIISERFPVHRRGLALNIVVAGGPVGIFIGSLVAGRIAEYYGWRQAFVLIGLPGILLAALILRSFPEMRPTAASTRSPFRLAVRRLSRGLRMTLAVRSSRFMLAAYSISSLFGAGLLSWSPAFFVRHHGLSVSEAAFWFGAGTGIGMLVGLLVGGVAIDRLVRRDVRWLTRLPAVALGIAVTLYVIALATQNTASALASFCLASVFVAASGGAAVNAIQTVLPPQARATAGAVIALAIAIVGMGAASLAIGWLSDMYAQLLGSSGLRAALLSMAMFGLPAMALMWIAAASVESDMAASQRSGDAR